MTIIYLILAHKNLGQVERMISALEHKNSLFFIHIDKKVPYAKIKESKFINKKNVTVLIRRQKIAWGGFNMVKATLDLLKSGIKVAGPGYFVLMSGQDFPIKSPGYIHKFLTENYGTEYVEHFALPNHRWGNNGGLDRIHYHWFIDKCGYEKSDCIYQFQKANKMLRPYLSELSPFGGSQWWCITLECGKFIIDFLRKNRNYYEYFETTCIPDETFFSTLILNSIFRERVKNDNLKFIDWNGGPAHPRVLNHADLEKLFDSHCLWARKFEPNTKESNTISEIEDRLKTTK